MNNPMSEDAMREKILSEISQNSAIITPEAIARKTLSVPGLFEAIYSATRSQVPSYSLSIWPQAYDLKT